MSFKKFSKRFLFVNWFMLFFYFWQNVVNLLKRRSFDDLFAFRFLFFFVQITMFFKVEANEKIIAIEVSFVFIAWYINFVFIAILIFFFFFCFLKYWKLTFCKLFCRARIVILMIFSDENISQIDVFARNIRSIIYSCTRMFSDCILDILCISFLCNFFCNISSFLCLILWLFSIESVYSRFLRRVFM